MDRIRGPSGLLRLEVLGSSRRREFHEAIRTATAELTDGRTTILPLDGGDPAARLAVVKVHVAGDRVEFDEFERLPALGSNDGDVTTIVYRTSRRALLVFELTDPEGRTMAVWSDEAAAASTHDEEEGGNGLFELVPWLPEVLAITEVFTSDSRESPFPPVPAEGALVGSSWRAFWTEMTGVPK